MVFALAAGTGATGIAAQDRDQAGVFDYYVMALSWSPNWCLREGDARGAAQCATDAGWVLHGLWPQYERGWPDYCRTSQPAPSRAMTRDMADVFGSAGLAWHQWRKHGTCTGLSARNYYRLSRVAYERVARPPLLRQLKREVSMPARLIEEAFLAVNPGLVPDGVTVTCRSGRIAEARICLTRDLEPRRCGADVIRDCSLEDALFAPIR
ncbi:MAG: ribonuclease T2 [Pseudomonadota bacterium]